MKKKNFMSKLPLNFKRNDGYMKILEKLCEKLKKKRFHGVRLNKKKMNNS